MQTPLNKVVFIQKVVAFTKTKSLKDLFRLAYVNNSWNDTIKNYCFHLFEERLRAAVKGELWQIHALEKLCARVIKCDVIWFLDVLMVSKTSILHDINVPMLVCKNNASSFGMMQHVVEKTAEVSRDGLRAKVTRRDEGGNNCILCCSRNSSSPEVMKLVFEKTVEVGGMDLLVTQLTETKNNAGMTCIMLACIHSSSTAVVNVLFEKVVEIGGKDVLQSQLTSTQDMYGRTCLMLGCSHSSSLEVMKLLFGKIFELGGNALIKSQLSATNRDGSTCLMLACSNSPSSEVMILLFEKIVESGGKEFLMNQLAATDGRGPNCLMNSCRNSSLRVVKLVFEKTTASGGSDFVKSQLSATTDDGLTCLLLACRYASLEVLNLFIRKILEVGGEDMVRNQVAAKTSWGATALLICCNYCFSAQVINLVATVLFHFDFFEFQYASLSDDSKKRLGDKADIKDAAWVPDPTVLAKVKAMMRPNDPAAPKKKETFVEGVALVKKAEDPKFPSLSSSFSRDD